MRLVNLKTSKTKTSTGRQAFNPNFIVKIGEANNGNTFLDLVEHGGKRSILDWTIYEPFDVVERKINEALKECY